MKFHNRLTKHSLVPHTLFGLFVELLVELSLHKVAVKPISSHLYSCINISRNKDGTFERLQSKLSILEKNKVEELGGSSGVGVPDSATLERIQQRWTRMHEAYSPNKKVQILLKVCKSIYDSMSANSSSGCFPSFSGNVYTHLLILFSFIFCSHLRFSRYSVWGRRFPSLSDLGASPEQLDHLTDRHRLHDGAAWSHTATGRGYRQNLHSDLIKIFYYCL